MQIIGKNLPGGLCGQKICKSNQQMQIRKKIWSKSISRKFLIYVNELKFSSFSKLKLDRNHPEN